MHTADWHVGKKLGRIDRRAEFEQVLDELVAIARDQRVDLVVVAGDLLDRAIAPYDAISLVLDALRRLADAAGHVVAIVGNHDSAVLFELLAPLLRDMGILLVPRIRRPGAGGVVTVASRDGAEAASVAAFPFLHEAEVVDFMAESEDWFKGYDRRVQGICRTLCEGLDPATVKVLTGHFFVAGAELGGGERRIQVGPQYAATAQAIPPTVHYAALGHVHRPQEIQGAAVRARYSGSIPRSTSPSAPTARRWSWSRRPRRPRRGSPPSSSPPAGGCCGSKAPSRSCGPERGPVSSTAPTSTSG